ncbi:BspA family leucine-rich repeat surface protein [Dyadobacter sp. LHD-138]|uniref:BspA family leucine-rich repeat surface protein n=1 Tax=Dyadobacter sp. LHD-138 TaxID=3071413 RepID=UPI0027DF83B4|nr:BspA family leucine-rich repeat surface protein [Dyadobacter sp. LHD-138]MDQ6479394.1 BspA family leucine-rich repeat surface protein [Dyadobacter sp. LHD-138]
MKTFTRDQRIPAGGFTSTCFQKLLFTLLCCFLYSISVKAQDHAGAFITIWDTDKMSADTHLEVPSTGTNYAYYWENVGDPGINAGANYITQSGNLSIPSIPNNTGKYRLYIKGNYTAISMLGNANSAPALTAVESWGNIVWSTMANAFRGCANLANIPIAAPDLSQVTSLRYMFGGASIFNNLVDHWNTSNVTDMSYMFSGAIAFNQPIASWNVEKVTNMTGMFNGATAFNQNIGNWQLKAGVSLVFFFNRCGLDCKNYGLTLKGWAQNSSTPQNIALDAVDIRYASDALVFRNSLASDKGWTFSDAGESFGCSI